MRALDGVSLDLPAGHFTAIMGPSGSGKSTLMHCMAGLDSLTSGQVFLGEQDLSQLSEDQLTLLRRDRIGFVFQAYNLVPTLTAIENIVLPLTLAGRKPAQSWLDLAVKTTGLADPAPIVANLISFTAPGSYVVCDSQFIACRQN